MLPTLSSPLMIVLVVIMVPSAVPGFPKTIPDTLPSRWTTHSASSGGGESPITCVLEDLLRKERPTESAQQEG